MPSVARKYASVIKQVINVTLKYNSRKNYLHNWLLEVVNAPALPSQSSRRSGPVTSGKKFRKTRLGSARSRKSSGNYYTDCRVLHNIILLAIDYGCGQRSARPDMLENKHVIDYSIAATQQL